MFGSWRLECVYVLFACWKSLLIWENIEVIIQERCDTKINDPVCRIYLASQNEDSVDVGEDAMKTEVNMGTNQRKNWGENTGPRLELGNKIRHAYFSYMTLEMIALSI